MNEQIDVDVPLTSFALDGEIDYDQLLEGTNSLLDCGNLPAKSMGVLQCHHSSSSWMYIVKDNADEMQVICGGLDAFLDFKKIQASSCPAFHKCQYQLLSC